MGSLVKNISLSAAADAVAAAAAAVGAGGGGGAAGEIVRWTRGSHLESVSLINYCIGNLRHRGDTNNTELQ